MHPHLGALQLQRGGDAQRGRVTDVVAVGLERRPQHGDVRAQERPAHELAGQVDGALAPPHVDLVDVLEEAQRLVDAELARARHERPDVLRQAAAAEADAGREEAAADAGVVADRVGQGHDVAAGGVAHVGHGVDERDLGGQERVGRHLDELGGCQVRADVRGTGFEHRGVHLPQHCVGPRRHDTDDEPVRELMINDLG